MARKPIAERPTPVKSAAMAFLRFGEPGQFPGLLSSFVFLDTTRYETHGAARTALERIYSGSRTIVITK